MLEIQNLSVDLGGRTILRDVDLSMGEGEHVALVGPNGAGKSTLLKCLTRILRHVRGSIQLNGSPLETYSQRDLARSIGYVPQSTDARSPFTVFEFVAMGRYPHLSPFDTLGPADLAVIRSALETTGMTGFAGRSMTTLSGGERQMAHVAAALAQEAPLLLLDEPTTFLDPGHQDEVHRLLERLNGTEGKTLLVVSHDLNAAALYSRRIVALRAGAVVFDGDAGEFMSNEILEPIYGRRFLFSLHPQSGVRFVVPRGMEP